MAKVNGQLVSCDRCGEQIFLNCTGEGEADGGWSRWNNFEALPEGWDQVAIPTRSNAPSGNAHNSYIYTCPACTALWRRVLNEYFLRDTPYYEVAHG